MTAAEAISPPSRRAYMSVARRNAAENTRSRIIEAACSMLRESGGAREFSIEAVALRARVTRRTVYRNFASQLVLIEAAMQDLSERGGIMRITGLKQVSDPASSLDQLVEFFVRFWHSDAALLNIYDALAYHADVSQAVQYWIALGTNVVGSIVAYACPGLDDSKRRDITNLIHAMLMPPVYRSLIAGRDVDQTIQLLQLACRATLSAVAEHR